MQDRNERMRKREQNRREHVDKNRENVRTIKQAINKGIENTRKAEQEKIARVRARKTKEKLERSFSPLISSRNNQQETIGDKLEKEYEESQANIVLLQELKMKEKKLLARLQATINNSMDVIEHAKAISSLSTHNKPMKGNNKSEAVPKSIARSNKSPVS